MKSSFTTGLVLICGATANPLISQAQHMTVIVRDFAGVPDAILQGAETQADRILGTAGVLVAWVQQPKYEIPLSKASPPTELVLDILPAGVTRRNVEPGALGYVVPSDSGPFGSYGGVLYDRVQDLTATGMSPCVILAYAFAHEIGHLLLGPRGHALSGIMKAKWGPAELKLAAEGRFGFHAAERRRLRKNLLRRLHSVSPLEGESTAPGTLRTGHDRSGVGRALTRGRYPSSRYVRIREV